MEKNTPIYMMIMVGMVALVAIVYMLTRPTVGTDLPNVQSSSSVGITGNVVADDIAPIDAGAVGRFLLGIALIGACVYAYRQW